VASVQHLGNDVLGRAHDVVVGRFATLCIGCHPLPSERLPESSLNRPRAVSKRRQM
jgi:hypothetical protein